LVKTCYDTELDQLILDYIEKQANGKTTFNSIVSFSGRSSRTISKHLTLLKTDPNMVIHWNRPKAGYKGHIELQDAAKLKRKYGYLSLNYSNVKGICKENESNIEINAYKRTKKKAILILLMSVSSGYSGYEVVSDVGAGDFEIRDPKGKPIAVRTTYEDGFSISDLQANDFQLPSIQNYVSNDKAVIEEVKKILDELQENVDVPLYRFSTKNDKIRIELKDRPLKLLLLWCSQILICLHRYMTQYWYILSKQPKSSEYEWFEFLMGKKQADNFFLKVEKNRVMKRTIKDLFVEFNYGNLDEVLVDEIVKSEQKMYTNLFTRKIMKDSLLHKSKLIAIILSYCSTIEKDEQIQQMLKENKYQFITEDLKYGICPNFLLEYEPRLYNGLNHCLDKN
jgi:hypothetical protein